MPVRPQPGVAAVNRAFHVLDHAIVYRHAERRAQHVVDLFGQVREVGRPVLRDLDACPLDVIHGFRQLARLLTYARHDLERLVAIRELGVQPGDVTQQALEVVVIVHVWLLNSSSYP